MNRYCFLAFAFVSCLSYAEETEEDVLAFHADYFEGFAQGVYYGLLLRDEDYQVAWCMKAELSYEAKALGRGEQFQRKIEGLLKQCRVNARAGPAKDDTD